MKLKLRPFIYLIPVVLLAPLLRPIPTDGASMDDVFNAPRNFINGLARGGGEPDREEPLPVPQTPPVRRSETPSNCLPPAPPAPVEHQTPPQINPHQVTMADEEPQPQVSRTAGLTDPKAIALMNIAPGNHRRSVISRYYPQRFDAPNNTDLYRTAHGTIAVVYEDASLNSTVREVKFTDKRTDLYNQ
jgi:hypothetical protein